MIWSKSPRELVLFARFGAQAFVSAHFGGWTHIQPGCEMNFIRKTIHRQPEFGNENGSDTENCSGYFIQEVDGPHAAQWLRGVGMHGIRGELLSRVSWGSAGSSVGGNEHMESLGSGSPKSLCNPKR